MGQDRTRRALSDQLINFLSRSFHLREKSEIVQKTSLKTVVPIRNSRVFVQKMDQDGTRRTQFNVMLTFLAAQIMIFEIIDGAMKNVQLIIWATKNLSIPLNRTC
jgi:hypothetical protein